MSTSSTAPSPDPVQLAPLLAGQRLLGVLKSYNSSTGFGFIVCSEAAQLFQRDVFIQRQEVEPCGATVGATISFTIELNKDGKPQARNVSVEAPGIKKKENDAMQIMNDMLTEIATQALEKNYLGYIKSFNQGNGFGFIACGETHRIFGRDVFLHQSQLNSFFVGDVVKFKLDIDLDKGTPRARELTAGQKASSEQMVPSVTGTGMNNMAGIAGLGNMNGMGAVNGMHGMNGMGALNGMGSMNGMGPMHNMGPMNGLPAMGTMGTAGPVSPMGGMMPISMASMPTMGGVGGMACVPPVGAMAPLGGMGSNGMCMGGMPGPGIGVGAMPSASASAGMGALGAAAPSMGARLGGTPGTAGANPALGAVVPAGVPGMGALGVSSAMCTPAGAAMSAQLSPAATAGLDANALGALNMDPMGLGPLGVAIFGTGDSVEKTLQAFFEQQREQEELLKQQQEKLEKRLAEQPKKPTITFDRKQRFVGIIRKFDRARGFGFIACDETYAAFSSDIFLHNEQREGFDVGDVVSFCLEPRGSHARARDLRASSGPHDRGEDRERPRSRSRSGRQRSRSSR